MIMLLVEKFGFEVIVEGIEIEVEYNWFIEVGCNIG